MATPSAPLPSQYATHSIQIPPALTLVQHCVPPDGLSALAEKDLGFIVEQFRPTLDPYEAIYRDIHQHPELSCKESRTASVVAKSLTLLNFTVHQGIGGHGVVGVLENGDGPVVMLRAELDALPIEEATGLPYASTDHMVDEYGFKMPVMHACGHDMHLACLLAASDLLRAARSRWHGTLIALFQTNEEHTGGAQAMLDGGLYEKIPVPDLVLGQHSIPLREGTVNIRSGPVLVAADTIHIRINSKIEHSINPQQGINPVDVICSIVVKLKGVVDIVASPEDLAVITPEEIHAGHPGLDTVYEAELVLDVKSYRSDVRQRLHEGIKRIVEAECRAAGIEQTPSIDIKIRAPLTNNSPDLVAALKQTFESYFKENVGDGEPRRPCEDFSLLASSQSKPYVFWFFGTVDAGQWDKAMAEGRVAELIPGNHSPYYAPKIHPTLRTGTDAMALAALTFLA